MKALNYISGLILILMSIGGRAQNTTEKSSRPNIVLLFIDDWAWNGTTIRMDEGMPNSKIPLLQMPNLNMCPLWQMAYAR